jgi:membrane-associated phospholipid phosphatase
MRLIPAAGLSVALVSGCQQFPRQTQSESAARISPGTVEAKTGGARKGDSLPETGSETSREPGVARCQSPLSAGEECKGSRADRSGFQDQDARAVWTTAFSATRQDHYRLPSRPGDETFYRSSFSAGAGTPIAGDQPLFTPDGSGGFASPVECIDRNPEFDDDPTIAESDGDPIEDAVPHVISWRDDIKQIPRMLWNDNLALYNWQNAIIIGAAAGGAVAIRDNLDKRVRQETAEEPLRWGQGSVVLRQFGEFAYQLPVMTGVYALSVWCEDDKLHEFSKAAFSAYGLSAMYTVAIKGITNTQRPSNEFQNGHYGFPSYHASSTFSLAAVIDEYYGWQAGIPAYVLAGLVGWSRIDQREHDLSDVVFGSVLGFVIGKTVACAHLEQYSGFRITPSYDPASGTAGVTVDTQF